MSESSYREVLEAQLSASASGFDQAGLHQDVRLQDRYYKNIKFMTDILRAVTRVTGEDKDYEILEKLNIERIRMAGILNDRDISLEPLAIKG